MCEETAVPEGEAEVSSEDRIFIGIFLTIGETLSRIYLVKT